jgi:phosphoribosyl 1,2-cyclic phosphate phosphodiesterase
VDAGPDCRAQLLAAGVGSLDAVIFTHAHADHVMGLDELRQINRVTGRALPAFGFPETLAELRNRFAYAFQPPTRGFFRPALTGTEVLPGDRIDIGEFSLSLFEQDHRVMRTLGLRLLDFGYSTDVATLGEASLGMLTGLDTWVVGCFQLESHPIHAGLADVAGWVSQLKPRRTVLTHMSSAMDWASLQRVLPKGVEPGFDLLQLEPVDLLQLEPGG